MTFSVIVPFHNEEEHIEKCVQALLNQSIDRSEYEIFFVDNNSTDKSASIVRKYLGINLLYENKQSSYSARNKGIQSSKGEIVAFTDADCVVDRDWLKNLSACLKESGQDIVLGSHKFDYGRSRILRMITDYENAKIEYIVTAPLSKNYYYGFTNNMAFKASVFKKVGLFSEVERGADTEFVHQYLSLESKPKITYLSGMSINHLEIITLKDWLRKQFIRGQSNKRLSSSVDYKALSFRRKNEIFGYTIKKYHYGFLRSLALFILLFTGNVFYFAGGCKYALHKAYGRA